MFGVEKGREVGRRGQIRVGIAEERLNVSCSPISIPVYL